MIPRKSASPEPTQEQADRMQKATMALIEALEKCGVSDDAGVSLGATGALLGSLAIASGNPDEALAMVNAIARGMIDGTLLDP